MRQLLPDDLQAFRLPLSSEAWLGRLETSTAAPHRRLTPHIFMGRLARSTGRESGLARFVGHVNLLFARNGIAYDLTAEGQARRLLPQSLAEALSWTVFATGDVETDRMLGIARRRSALPKAEDRQDALERLWDAFERLKTLEPGAGKRARRPTPC